MLEIKLGTPEAKQYQQLLYNGLDCCGTLEINQKLDSIPVAKEVEEVYRLNHQLWVPALTMMRRGLLVDQEAKNKRLLEAEEILDGIQSESDSLIKILKRSTQLNIGSPAQLLSLFNSLGANVTTTQETTLENLLFDDNCKPFAELALKHRRAGKNKQVLGVELDNGRMRPGFNVTGTVTGRWSSRNNAFWRGTNVQNITPELRSIFIPDPGMVFVEADFRQADSNIVAWASGDERYIEAHRTGNAHENVAAMLFDTDEFIKSIHDIVFKDISYYALTKRFSHACNYLVGKRTLAQSMRIEEKKSAWFIKIYFKRFSGIKRWQNKIKQDLEAGKPIITPHGRRRRFFGRRKGVETLQDALAHIGQGTVADCTNQFLLNCWLIAEPQNIQMLAQIHDSVFFQVPKNKLESSINLIQRCGNIPIPFESGNQFLRTSIKTGFNWRDMEAWKEEN